MGDLARCRGWVDRVTELLEQAGIDCVEQGYLEHGLGMMRIFEAGDLAGAHAHFVQAGKIAARYAHRELATLARIAEGRMLIYLGDLRRGDGAARRGHGVDRGGRPLHRWRPATPTAR